MHSNRIDVTLCGNLKYFLIAVVKWGLRGSGRVVEGLCNTYAWKDSVKSFCCLFSGRTPALPTGKGVWNKNLGRLCVVIVTEDYRWAQQALEELWGPWDPVAMRADGLWVYPLWWPQCCSSWLQSSKPHCKNCCKGRVTWGWGWAEVVSTTGGLGDTAGGCSGAALQQPGLHPTSGPVCLHSITAPGLLGRITGQFFLQSHFLDNAWYLCFR